MNDGQIKEHMNVRQTHRKDTFSLLRKYKELIRQNPQYESQLLEKLEKYIEATSMCFDDSSIFHNCSYFIQI